MRNLFILCSLISSYSAQAFDLKAIRNEVSLGQTTLLDQALASNEGSDANFVNESIEPDSGDVWCTNIISAAAKAQQWNIVKKLLLYPKSNFNSLQTFWKLSHGKHYCVDVTYSGYQSNFSVFTEVVKSHQLDILDFALSKNKMIFDSNSIHYQQDIEFLVSNFIENKWEDGILKYSDYRGVNGLKFFQIDIYLAFYQNKIALTKIESILSPSFLAGRSLACLLSDVCTFNQMGYVKRNFSEYEISMYQDLVNRYEMVNDINFKRILLYSLRSHQVECDPTTSTYYHEFISESDYISNPDLLDIYPHVTMCSNYSTLKASSLRIPLNVDLLPGEKIVYHFTKQDLEKIQNCAISERPIINATVSYDSGIVLPLFSLNVGNAYSITHTVGKGGQPYHSNDETYDDFGYVLSSSPLIKFSKPFVFNANTSGGQLVIRHLKNDYDENVQGLVPAIHEKIHISEISFNEVLCK